jgi:hypothetical protein
MSGAIPPLQYAFMAWCLVKAQGQLYLYLYLPQLVSRHVTSSVTQTQTSITYCEHRNEFYDAISIRNILILYTCVVAYYT